MPDLEPTAPSSPTEPTSPGVTASPLDLKSSETATVLSLIKSATEVGTASAVMERRKSVGLAPSAETPPRKRRVSKEVQEINELLSGDASATKEKLRERRKSLSASNMPRRRHSEPARPSLPDDSSDDPVAAPNPLTELAAPAKPVSTELDAINERIRADRVARAARRAATEAEKEAFMKKVDHHDDDARNANTALSGAAALGAAKGAAKVAGGVFVTREEWEATRRRIKELEEQVRQLKVEAEQREGSMDGSMHGAARLRVHFDTASSAPAAAPEGGFASKSRNFLESIMRQASPMLRRASSGSSRSPSFRRANAPVATAVLFAPPQLTS